MARVRRARRERQLRGLRNPSPLLGQAPLQSPSVFNFFSPVYAPPGEIRDAGLVAPELEIANEYQNTSLTNALRTYTFNRNSRTPGLTPEDIVIDIEAEVAVAADANALVNLVADKLLAGQISTPLRTEMVNLVNRYGATDGPNRAAQAVYSVVTSPEYALQHERKTDASRTDRREFLLAAGTSAAGLLLARPHNAIGQMVGGPAPFTDYRALVCVFLFGGNDSFNMLVPRSAAEHNAYLASRQNLAIAQADLLPIAPLNPDGAQYGLHPSMPGIRDLFEQEHAAFVANVGPLLAPTTKAQYQAKSVALPPQLFSHNDQQNQWHSLRGNTLSDSGWAGRIADLIRSNVANQQLATNVSLNGNSLFQSGDDTVAYSMGAGGPLAFSGFGAAGPAARAATRVRAHHRRNVRLGLRARFRRRAAACRPSRGSSDGGDRAGADA